MTYPVLTLGKRALGVLRLFESDSVILPLNVGALCDTESTGGI